MVGIAAWTRPEGLLYFLINLVVLLAHVLRSRSAVAAILLYTAAFCVMWGPWAVYTRLHGYGSYLVGPAVSTLRELANLQFSSERLILVLRYFQAQWTSFDTWGSVWVLFGLSLLRWRAVRQHGYLVAITLLNIAALLFTYYATPETPPLTWWLETGFSRMALHFMPLLWVYIGLAWEMELAEAVRWYWGRVRPVFARPPGPLAGRSAEQ